MAASALSVAEPFYTQADASQLARAPAIVPSRKWSQDQDWEDMRAYLEQILLGLRNWRTPWWMHWGEIATNLLPRRYHWLVTPNNMIRGLPINQNVIDSTPPQAHAVCAAGMMDGLSSPSKQWFRIRVPIPGFEPDTLAQRWLNDFQQRIYDVLAGSNYYDAKHQYYEDEIAFGTAPMLIYENRAAIINCQVPCAGEYFLGASGTNGTDVFNREFPMTVRQMMGLFGPEALTGTNAGQLWNSKGANLETEFKIGHSIEPNFPANMPGQKPNLGVVPGGYTWREYYWLQGQSTPRPLSVRGFHEKPFMAAKWSQRSNDPYGRGCPGMDGLPDIMQLHQMQRRLAEAIDKMVRPPMLADASMKNEPASIIAGRVTYVASLAKDTGMRPAYLVDPKVDHMMQLIEQIQNRIKIWFHNDTFQAISEMDGVQPRNELEINERRSEKLLKLGPVIERNLREDAIGMTRIVSIMGRRGLIPPKPASLRGLPISVKFTSKLAQIQEALKTGAMERTISMAGRMEAVLPGTLDNVEKDKFIRTYGDALDYPAEDWADDAAIKATRAARDKAQQQALAAHQIQNTVPAAAGAAKDLSDTDTGGGVNALQLMVGGGMPMTGGQQQ